MKVLQFEPQDSQLSVFIKSAIKYKTITYGDEHN